LKIAKIKAIQQELSMLRKSVDWGLKDEDLPTLSKGSETRFCGHTSWVIMDNYICDVSKFRHPGGEALLKKHHGKDVTKAFNGIFTTHTPSARERVKSLRVGKSA
jgi:hypothetical protein